MAGFPERRPVPASPTLYPSERSAVAGSEGYPSATNRFVTENDITRQLDAILTDGTDILLGSDGGVLYG